MTSRHLVPTLALLASCAGSSFPPAVIPARPGPGDWPDAGAAVLEDEATLEYRIAGTGRPARVVAVLDHRRRLKILSEPGLAAAQIDLPIDAFSTVRNVRARSVSPSGRVVELSSAEVSEVPLPTAGAAGDSLRVVRMKIPRARVGGLVEYRYERVFADAALVPAWVFGSSYPVLRSQLSLITEPGISVDYRFGRGTRLEQVLPLRRSDDSGRERLVFVMNDLPAHYEEPDMPHPTQEMPWLATVVTAAQGPSGTKRLETWEAVGLHLQEYLDRVGGEPGTGSPVARFRAVRNAVRPVNSIGLGLLAPVPASELMAGAPACNRDSAALLLAALAGSGANAHPALIASPLGAPVLADFPALYPFVQVVVAVHAEGPANDKLICDKPNASIDPACRASPNGYILLDPSCRHCRYGELPWALAGGRALVFDEAGPKWIDLPLDPPEQHRLTSQASFTFIPDGTLRGTLEAEATGNLAGQLRALATQAKDATELTSALAPVVLGVEVPASLRELNLIASSAVEQPLTFKARVDSRMEKAGYEHFFLRATDLAGHGFVGPWRKTRRYAALIAGPSSREQTVTMEMPIGYDCRLPPPTSLTSAFGDYNAGFSRRERTLTYSRHVRLKVHKITAEDWDAFRSFLDRVEQEERTPVELWLVE